MSIDKSPSSQLPETTNTHAKCKANKSKEGRPRMPIWNDFNEGEDDGHGHFGVSCHYCDKGRWQRGKPSTMEAHLVLYCKGLVPDDIRKNTVITNNGSNVCIAQQSIHYDYSHILNIYCIAHALNLLAVDLVKNALIKMILKQANMLVSFVQKLHLASRILRDTISSMNIRGRSLETYCETCWALIYDIANSIVRVRPAIYKILEEQPEIFTNHEVFEIANDENDNFYTSSSLADCFLEIVQLAAIFRRIPTSNNFRSLAIAAFNSRYQQFDVFPYVLTYFLYPYYRGHGLQKEKFRDIYELAVNYYKDLHHNEKEYCVLVSQLIKYKANATPWDLEFSFNLTPYVWWGVVEDEHTHLQELAKTMFAIVPSQANCERNFSILKWFSEGQLNFCDDNSVEMELRNSVFNEIIFAEINGPDLRNKENEEKIVNPTKNKITMAFQDCVDISDPIFEINNNQDEIILTKEEEANMNFK
ncbi:26821_t:CDS:2, partial [Gigaspora margarita]